MREVGVKEELGLLIRQREQVLGGRFMFWLEFVTENHKHGNIPTNFNFNIKYPENTQFLTYKLWASFPVRSFKMCNE